MDYVIYLSKLIPRFCKKGQLVLRKGPFCTPKGALLQPERNPFAPQVGLFLYQYLAHFASKCA